MKPHGCTFPKLVSSALTFYEARLLCVAANLMQPWDRVAADKYIATGTVLEDSELLAWVLAILST